MRKTGFITVVSLIAAIMVSVPLISECASGIEMAGSEGLPSTSCCGTVTGPENVYAWVYGGSYVSVSFEDYGEFEFQYAEFAGDSQGLSLSGRNLTGNITGTVSVSFCYYDFAQEFDLCSDLVIYCIAVTTTTSFSESTVYTVEGSSTWFTVNGTVSNGAQYSATLSTDGGTLGTYSITGNTTVEFTAPYVDGSQTFHVTATSSVSGAEQSSAVLTVIVVDALTEGVPSVGSITST